MELDCSQAKLVWKAAGIQPDRNAGRMRDWVEEMFTLLDKDNFILFLTLLCSIWDRRNNWVFEGRFVEAQFLVTNALGLLDCISPAPKPLNSASTKPDHWTAPPPGWVKLNVDAAVFDEIGAGWGYVLRDHRGDVIKAGSQSVSFTPNPLIAEAMAIRAGLLASIAPAVPHILVELDSETIIKALNAKDDSWPLSIAPILADICSIANSSGQTSWKYIPRNCNLVAHHLARLIKGEDKSVVWNLPLPANVMHFIVNDILPLSL